MQIYIQFQRDTDEITKFILLCEVGFLINKISYESKHIKASQHPTSVLSFNFEQREKSLKKQLNFQDKKTESFEK